MGKKTFADLRPHQSWSHIPQIQLAKILYVLSTVWPISWSQAIDFGVAENAKMQRVADRGTLTKAVRMLTSNELCVC